MSAHIEKLRQPIGLWMLYFAVYIPVGFMMNGIGQLAEIAMFAHWWQVITCYGLYLVPASILWKHRSWFDQYLWGLLVLGLLEVAGYTLGTSIAFPGNVLDQMFTERNFSLAMTLFFGAFIPAGNAAVAAISGRLNRPALVVDATAPQVATTTIPKSELHEVA